MIASFLYGLAIVVTELISFVIQFTAIFWENNDDKGEKGDTNKTGDVYIRAAIMACTAILGYVIRSMNFLHFGSLAQVAIGIGKVYLLAIGLFVLMFDYILNINRDRRDWFEYLGEKGTIDNIKWWRNMRPEWRLVVRASFCLITLIIYFN